jgi:hypothetical protein
LIKSNERPAKSSARFMESNGKSGKQIIYST